MICASCLPKKENDYLKMANSTNTNPIKEKEPNGIFESFACGLSVLLFSIWGLCSPVYCILFRKGYNYFSSCTDSMPKESMIYKDFFSLRDDFSFLSIFCGIGALIIYAFSVIIVIFISMLVNWVNKFFIFNSLKLLLIQNYYILFS
jgi:hypothetical protein